MQTSKIIKIDITIQLAKGTVFMSGNYLRQILINAASSYRNLVVADKERRLNSILGELEKKVNKNPNETEINKTT